MSELFEKSMNTLELPKVLAMLAECAVTQEGREHCTQLRPMTCSGHRRKPARQ